MKHSHILLILRQLGIYIYYYRCSHWKTIKNNLMYPRKRSTVSGSTTFAGWKWKKNTEQRVREWHENHLANQRKYSAQISQQISERGHRVTAGCSHCKASAQRWQLQQLSRNSSDVHRRKFGCHEVEYLIQDQFWTNDRTTNVTCYKYHNYGWKNHNLKKRNIRKSDFFI